MKKSILLLMALVAVMFQFSCTENHQTEESTKLSNAIESYDESAKREANEELKKIIQSDVNHIAGEVVKFDITGTTTVENENLLAINISFITETDIESNVVLVKRKNHNESEGGYECYTVTCSGCDGCGVTSTDTGNGQMQHSCWEPCCDMNINERDNCDRIGG